MSLQLYNREILKLAASLIADDHLPDVDGTAEARSAICGSRIIADVCVDGESRICALALRANACALGQASAGILRQHAVGQDMDHIKTIRNDLAAFFANEGEMPAVWPELQVLGVARDYKARHSAILLPYDALIAALKDAYRPDGK